MDAPLNKDHSPILVHIEPRGYKYNDLFCERSDGKTRLIQLQQEVFDLFSDKIFFPDELTAPGGDTSRYGSIHEALADTGWPLVDPFLRGKIIFNLNIFSSNAACKPLYWSLPGASISRRLDKSDRFAKVLNGDGVTTAPTRDSIATTNMHSVQVIGPSSSNSGGDWRQWKRKVFFNRGTIEEAKITNTTATMEVTSGAFALNPAILSHGFITRYRVGKEPEASEIIVKNHDLIPATLISYDGIWAG